MQLIRRVAVATLLAGFVWVISAFVLLLVSDGCYLDWVLPWYEYNPQLSSCRFR